MECRSLLRVLPRNLNTCHILIPTVMMLTVCPSHRSLVRSLAVILFATSLAVSAADPVPSPVPHIPDSSGVDLVAEASTDEGPAPAVSPSPDSPTSSTALRPGEGRPVNRMIFGMNQDWQNGNFRFDDPVVQSGLVAVGVTSLRFPSGTPSVFWDWREAQFVDDTALKAVGPPQWFQRHKTMKERIKRMPSGALSIDNFAMLCRIGGIEPIWSTNFISSEVSEAVAMVHHIKEKGYPARYFELGNEYYFGFYKDRFPTGAAYVQKGKPIVDAIRTEFPAAKIAVCASQAGLFVPSNDRPADEYEAGNDWNQGLWSERQNYDAWVIHSYGMRSEVLRNLPRASWESAFLVYPDRAMRLGAQFSRTRLEAMPFWLTEFNVAYQRIQPQNKAFLGDAADQFLLATKNSHLHAIHTASYLLAAIADHDIWTHLNYHSFAGMDGFAVFRVSDSGAELNPTARLFSKLSRIGAEAKTMASVDCSDGPFLDLELLGKDPIPALQAAVFKSEGELVYVVINRDRHPRQVFCESEPGFTKTTLETVSGSEPPSPAPWTPLSNDPVIPAGSSAEVRSNGTQVEFVAPPLSLSILSCRQ